MTKIGVAVHIISDIYRKVRSSCNRHRPLFVRFRNRRVLVDTACRYVSFLYVRSVYLRCLDLKRRYLRPLFTAKVHNSFDFE